MLRFVKWTSPLLAFGLVMALLCAKVRAEDKKDTGTITGTVVDQDGKAVSGAKIAVFHWTEHKDTAKTEEKPKEKELAEGDKPAAPKEKQTPVATGTSDDSGKFTLSDVPAGTYRVVARVKGKGQGVEKAEVKAGETADVKLTLGEVMGKKK
jgi:hypothetical protein